jgi:pentatricopeptide repeat protein
LIPAGLTKLVSQLTREGNWQKGLEVFESLSTLSVRPDTTITNAAISACDKGGQWEKAMQVGNFCTHESAGTKALQAAKKTALVRQTTPSQITDLGCYVSCSSLNVLLLST